MDCPNGDKIIEWQYPEGDLNQIMGADSFSVEREKGKCRANYLISGKVLGSSIPSGTCGVEKTVEVTIFDAIFEEVREIDYGGEKALSVFYKNAQNQTQQVRMKTPGTSFRAIGTEGCINVPISYSYIRGSFKDLSIVRTDGQPDNCGDCVFKVIKNGSIVKTIKKEDCPEVIEKCGESCPPDTCECRCGGEICCYSQNTGDVVKSFRKTSN